MTLTASARFLPSLLLSMLLVACGGGSNTSTPPDMSVTPPVTTPITIGKGVVALETSAFVDSTLSATSVGPAGGVLTVTGGTDSLAGASLTFPAGAVTEVVNVSVSSAAIASAAGLPDGASSRSRAIRVQMTSADSGAAVGGLAKLVLVTLPVDPDTTDAVAYYQLENDGALESMGFDRIDPTTHAISFWTRAPSATGTVTGAPLAQSTARRIQDATPTPLFATYVAVGVAQTTLAGFASQEAVIDSGFRPSVNGFSIPNYGSYYGDTRGGNCFGIAGFAKYYYQMGYTSPLVDTYRDAQKTATWIDDAVAIELATRAQTQLSDIWATLGTQELAQQTSATAVARSLVGALYVTGRPALIYLDEVVGGESAGAHAVSAWKATLHADGGVTFGVYDPNAEKDDSHVIDWSPASGFAIYNSSTATGRALVGFNVFKHIGLAAGFTPDSLARDKSDADSGYSDSLFPKITITSIKGETLGDDVMANPGTTVDGMPSFKTADTAVIIQGTVLGADAQTEGHVVDNLNVYSPFAEENTSVDNQAGGGTGKFEIVVSLKNGVNPVSLLASDFIDHSANWAAFKQVIVESAAAPSYFSATLTWNRGTSDVDLYVKEPDGAAGGADAGKTGDLVAFYHRAGASTTNAYLDYDNTDGFGPEHYLVQPGLTTMYTDGTSAQNPYGTYTIGVHYFSWNGDAQEPDRSIAWTVNWRYLKSCNNACANPETDGLWAAGVQTGTIAADDANQAGPTGFASGGSAWSPKFQVAFPAATTSWTVPPSNTVMLP